MNTHMRRASWLALVATVIAGCAVSATASPATVGHSRSRLQVGSVVLHRCNVYPGAFCGDVRRRWDPRDPSLGHLSVGFAFVPAKDQSDSVLGTVVPHEGGPGYATTDSAIDYAGMYGPLLRHRNLLLIDQRGTGRSAAINCPLLQDLHGSYAKAAGVCGRSLGDHADLYGSAQSSDDQAGVIRRLALGKVDLYGDSYGTFFTEVFAGRHPDQVNSIVLDSAYPPTGESAWYPTQTPAMRHSLTIACRRGPACAAAKGTPTGLLRRVLRHVRRSPYRGVAHDGDGIPRHVVVTAASLVGVAFGATYGPEYYREFAASLRAALHRDRRPLLRLVAETNYGSADAGPVKAYSEGLDAAVTCHDYPQLFNLADSPAKRRVEYAASVAREQKHHPHVYAPFTVKEYLHSVWEEADWCLDWPSPSAAHPAEPPAPPSGQYPAVPTLVLSGELDSITTPAEGALVAAEFPDSRQVLVANSFHVTAEDDTDGCGASLVRRFTSDPTTPLSNADLRCTTQVPPVRSLGDYRSSYRATAAAKARSGNQVGVDGRRAAATAAQTVVDAMDRWVSNYSGHQVGLYGGTVRFSGSRDVMLRLHRYRMTRDLAVSGTAHWDRYAHTLRCQLRLRARSQGHASRQGSGSLVSRWDTRRDGAIAMLHGRLDGQHLSAVMTAP